MNIKKKKVAFAIAVTALLFPVIFSHVKADDDDDDDYEQASSVSTSTNSTSKTKPVTETIVVTPARTVIEDQIRTILLPDRDRDGIADKDDANPDVAEIYIVKDDNANGIVDKFEYEK